MAVKAARVPVGQMAAETVQLISTPCVFLVGNMHMISRETAALKQKQKLVIHKRKKREREDKG